MATKLLTLGAKIVGKQAAKKLVSSTAKKMAKSICKKLTKELVKTEAGKMMKNMMEKLVKKVGKQIGKKNAKMIAKRIQKEVMKKMKQKMQQGIENEINKYFIENEAQIEQEGVNAGEKWVDETMPDEWDDWIPIWGDLKFLGQCVDVCDQADLERCVVNAIERKINMDVPPLIDGKVDIMLDNAVEEACRFDFDNDDEKKDEIDANYYLIHAE
eukprot:250323_1